jgi:phage gp29-like protein
MNGTSLYDPLKLQQMEKWREYYNPLRFLTVGMVLAWLQEQQLGIVSNITWLYRFVEERDPTLSALLDRRLSAMEKLDWDVKQVVEDEIPQGFTKADADAQALELRTRYNNLDNLRDAVNFVALASFRGYSHLEKHYDENGIECHLEPVPQWNWARSGLYGLYYYNQSAQAIPGPTPGGSLDPNLKAIDLDNFIIREVDRPIDVIAVFCFLRKNMSQKDWDAFIEVFGIPPIFIVMPPDMPVDKQAEYQAVAEAIVGDARGTLPHGADVKTVSPEKGADPFAAHIKYQDEQIVLKGTGGLLTMLTQQGSGHHAGNVHQDSFDTIAEAEARKISEEFQRQFDGPILKEKFPDQPKLAWFELAAKELTETSKVVADVASLAGAGLDVDPDQIEEKTGYSVTKAAPVDLPVVPDKGAPRVNANRASLRDLLLNRTDDRELEALIKTLGEHIDDATDGSWAPIMNRLQALLDGPDAGFVANAKQFVADVPELLKPTHTDDKTIAAWQNALSAALLNGLTAVPAKKTNAAPKRRTGKARK